jgi:hypothetical protein
VPNLVAFYVPLLEHPHGSQTIDLQRDALIAAAVDPAEIYEDRASGRLDARPGLDAT